MFTLSIKRAFQLKAIWRATRDQTYTNFAKGEVTKKGHAITRCTCIMKNKQDAVAALQNCGKIVAVPSDAERQLIHGRGCLYLVAAHRWRHHDTLEWCHQNAICEADDEEEHTCIRTCHGNHWRSLWVKTDTHFVLCLRSFSDEKSKLSNACAWEHMMSLVAVSVLRQINLYQCLLRCV